MTAVQAGLFENTGMCAVWEAKNLIKVNYFFEHFEHQGLAIDFEWVPLRNPL